MVKLCKKCKWSIPDPSSSWSLICINEEVNANDPWALSSAKISGSSCKIERDRRWFSPCGIKGKKWEQKDE